MTASPTLERPAASHAPARAAAVPTAQRNAFTIDVEDYYQVHAFAGAVKREDWETLPSRVVGNTTAFLLLKYIRDGAAQSLPGTTPPTPPSP